MYIYIHNIYIYIYIYTYTYIHIYIYAYTHIHTHTHMRTHTHTYIHTYATIKGLVQRGPHNVCIISMRMYIHKYTHEFPMTQSMHVICMYTYMCIYILLRTYLLHILIYVIINVQISPSKSNSANAAHVKLVRTSLCAYIYAQFHPKPY